MVWPLPVSPLPAFFSMTDSAPHAPFLAPEPASLAPLFPGYVIESLIAVGGMGAVYRAIQKSLDRTVAIKILPQEFTKDAAFCAGFEAEAKAMARLNHPNLIGVYDFGKVNEMLFIVMEYVPGKSLFHSSHGVSIEPAEVVRLVTGICSGLAHAHDNGIIHRDIKPSNVLLDLNANPKIGDFGLAQPIGETAQDNEEIYGTPHYTAPEVVHSPRSVGHRADLFSVGVILHELLTGQLPANDPRPASMISKCDLRFDAIIRRATNPIPELRYGSVTELAADLQGLSIQNAPRVLGTPPSAAALVPRRLPTGRSIQGRPAAQQSSNAIGIIMLLLAVFIVAATFCHFSARQKQRLIKQAKEAQEQSLEPYIPAPSPERQPTLPERPDPSPTFPGPTVPSGGPSDGSTQPEPVTPPETPNPPTAPIDPPVSEVPKFDVPGFFDRARKIMQERTAPLLANHKLNLSRNVRDLELAGKRLIRQVDRRQRQQELRGILDGFASECSRAGNRIPHIRSADFDDFSDMRPFQKQFYAKQTDIDEVLIQETAKLAPTYILGLEKQIVRLKVDKDTAAADLIVSELEQVRNQPDYFPTLMLGSEFRVAVPYEEHPSRSPMSEDDDPEN
jgi:serine/threonine protein kinase